MLLKGLLKSRLIVSFLLVLLAFGLLEAQISQTGTISGSIVTEDGSVVPGVSIELRSPAIIVEKIAVVSNEEGAFRFRNLPPGSYELTFKLEGMKTLVRKGIVVSVGGTTNLDVAMEFGTLTENIEVSGKAPTIDVQATAKTTNISTEMIQLIPTRNRDLAGIFSLTPGVQNGVANGSGERNNSWNVDGVNTNDPVVGTRGTTPAAEVLQEVAVSVGGVGADQATSGGAIINAVTKSGGNEFSGSASVYYNHESFNGDNTKGTVLEGSASGEKFNFNPSVSLGGPVIKNKLWFFGSYSLLKSETYVQGYPADKDQEIPQDHKEPYIYGKLTFQPSANDKIYFSYSFSDLIYHHRGAGIDEIESSTWEQSSKNHNYNVDWSHNFSNNFYGTLKFASAPINFDLMSKNGKPYMWDLYTQKLLPGSGYGFSDYNARSRFQFQTDFTLFVDDFIGQHEWKAGADYTMAKSERHFEPGGAESTQQAGYHPYYITYWNGEPYYAYFYNDHTEKDKMRILSAYLQDTWSPTRKLTLTLGVRLEHSKGIIPAQNESSTGYFLPEFFGNYYPLDNAVTEEFTAMTWTNIAPRLALSYDFAGDGKTVLKASYGRYYEALISQYFSTVNPNGFAYFVGPYDPDTNTVYDIWGLDLPRAGTLGYNGEDPTAPYEDQFTVSLERELFADWSVTLRGIYNEKRNILEDVDMNSLDMDALMNDGELVWTNWSPVPVTDPVTGSTLYFYEQINTLLPSDLALVNIPGQSREYKALEVIVKKRFSKGWMLEASYVLSKLEGLFNTSFNATTGITNFYNNPNDHVNAYGRLENDRRHQLKVLGMVRGPWDINLSGVIQWRSGNPYSRWLDSDEQGVSLSGGDSDRIIAGTRGEYVLPDQFNVDLALEKQFKIKNFGLALFAQAFNVFNSGVADAVQITSSHSSRPFGQMTSITDPFYLRIGARIDFN